MARKKAIKLEPVGINIVVRVEVAADESKGGIIIPESAKDKPQRGVVVAVGPKCEQVKTKDKVVFSPYGGQLIEVAEGKQVFVLTEEDILVIVK